MRVFGAKKKKESWAKNAKAIHFELFLLFSLFSNSGNVLN